MRTLTLFLLLIFLIPAARADSAALADAIRKAKAAGIRVDLRELGLQSRTQVGQVPTPSITGVPRPAPNAGNPLINTIGYADAVESRIKTLFIDHKNGMKNWAVTAEDVVNHQYNEIVDTVASLCCNRTPHGTDPRRVSRMKARNMMLEPNPEPGQ